MQQKTRNLFKEQIRSNLYLKRVALPHKRAQMYIYSGKKIQVDNFMGYQDLKARFWTIPLDYTLVQMGYKLNLLPLIRNIYCQNYNLIKNYELFTVFYL